MNTVAKATRDLAAKLTDDAQPVMVTAKQLRDLLDAIDRLRETLKAKQ